MAKGRLEGRHILITGAAAGMGKVTAELFVREGARVALLDANDRAVRAVAKKLGAAAVAASADVTDEASVAAAVAQCAKALGGLDGVVNAAGIHGYSPVGEFSAASWQRMLAVNLIGPALVIQAAHPWLKKARRASIVNFASVQGIMPFARSSAYAASKAGLIGMTKSMARELGPKIRVNSICPGSIDTPMLRRARGAKGPDTSGYALQRLGRPMEVAEGVLYLTGDESSYVTGMTLVVDGGRAFH